MTSEIPRPSPRTLAGLYCLLILLAVCTFHSRVLFHADVTFPWDFTGYHYPLVVAYADALHSGELPLWDPLTYCGRPLLANPQLAGFYPPLAVVAAWGRDGLLARLEWLAVAHIALAGMLTFFLALRLGTTSTAALVAALAFSLGPFYASQVQHLGMVMGSPWLVLAWYAVFCESRIRILILSLAWAGCLLAGFTAFFLVTVVSTLLLAFLAAPRLRLTVELALAGILAAVLSLAQLGLSLELLRESIAKYRTDWMGFGGGIPPEALLTALLPNYFHTFEPEHFSGRADLTLMYIFLGWSIVASIAVGIRAVPRWLLVLTLLLGVLMIGEWSPVGSVLFSVLPAFLQRTTYWYPYLAPFTLAISLAAAFGTGSLGRFSHLVPIVLAIELFTISSRRPMNSQTLDPFLAATIDPTAHAAGTRLLADLRTAVGDRRLDTIADSPAMAASAPVFGWRTAGGYDPMALEGLMRLRQKVAGGERWGAYHQITNSNAVEVDQMSIGILTSRSPLADPGRLTPRGEVAGRHIYSNPAALPRYRANRCNVSVTSETRNRVELQLDCQYASVLETSEAHFGAWRALLDQRAVPIELLHGAFRSISVGSGVHQAVFYYAVDSLYQYLAGSIAGLFAWLSLALSPAYRTHRSIHRKFRSIKSL